MRYEMIEKSVSYFTVTLVSNELFQINARGFLGKRVKVTISSLYNNQYFCSIYSIGVS